MRKTFQGVLEGKSMGMAMREAGYTEAYSKVPQLLARSKGWKELLATIDDSVILANVFSIATDTEDKRASLQAAHMIFNLKDRYPAGKLKIQAYNEELERLKE